MGPEICRRREHHRSESVEGDSTSHLGTVCGSSFKGGVRCWLVFNNELHHGTFLFGLLKFESYDLYALRCPFLDTGSAAARV